MDLEKLINSGLKGIKPYIPGTPIIEVLKKYGIKNPIKMNSNENPIGISKKALGKAKKLLHSANIYPDPSNRKLVNTIATIYNLSPDCVAVGSGADELIYYLAMVFINNGDNAVIPEITFPIYETAVRIMRGNIKKSKMKGYKIDTEAILNTIDQHSKMIFFCNPNNPTGDAIGHKDFYDFLKKVPQDMILVVDEAYGDFAEIEDFPETVELMKSEFKNLVIIKTMSKSHGFAGLRVGYCLADRGIIELINRIRLPFNLTYISQEAATGALLDTSFYNKTIKTIKEGKKMLYRFFNELGLNYIPSNTNYILVDTGFPAEKITERLMEKGILVRNATPYGFPTFIRVTIGTKRQNRIFMKNFKEIYFRIRGNT